MMDVSRQLEELTEELANVQNKVQIVIRALRSEQNERSSAKGEKPLTAVEEGESYAGLREEGYSVSDIATRIGKTGQFVRDRISLWNSDPMLKEASKDWGKGGIGLTAAKGIARLVKDHERQREFVKRAKKSRKARRKVLEELRLVFPKRVRRR